MVASERRRRRRAKRPTARLREARPRDHREGVAETRLRNREDQTDGTAAVRYEFGKLVQEHYRAVQVHGHTGCSVKVESIALLWITVYAIIFRLFYFPFYSPTEHGKAFGRLSRFINCYFGKVDWPRMSLLMRTTIDRVVV